MEARPCYNLYSFYPFMNIFSSAWLCQQSSWNRNSFVIRPSSICGIDYLSHHCMDFFQILVVASLCHMNRLVFIFEKNFFWGGFFYEYFLFSLTRGSKLSKRYSSLKPLLNPFKLFLKFLLSGSHKTTVLDYWNLEYLIFHVFFFLFVNMGLYVSQNFKTLLLHQITFESFQPFSCELLKFCVFDF